MGQADEGNWNVIAITPSKKGQRVPSLQGTHKPFALKIVL